MTETRLIARAKDVVAVAIMRRDAVAIGPFGNRAGDIAFLMNVARGAKGFEPQGWHGRRSIGEPLGKPLSLDAP
jgi:hypothetical protein